MIKMHIDKQKIAFNKTGERYFELNEHAIRHYQTKYGAQPVLSASGFFGKSFCNK